MLASTLVRNGISRVAHHARGCDRGPSLWAENSGSDVVTGSWGYGQQTLTAKSTDQKHCTRLTVGITLQCEPVVLRYQLENKATEWCQMGVLLLTPGLDHGLPQAMQP